MQKENRFSLSLLLGVAGGAAAGLAFTAAVTLTAGAPFIIAASVKILRRYSCQLKKVLEKGIFMSRGTAKVTLICIALFLGLFVIFRPTDDPKESLYWLSLVIGSALGSITCIFMALAWKPAETNSKSDKELFDSRLRWMPLVVIGGLVASWLATTMLPSEHEILLTNCVVLWLIVTVSYLVIRS